MLGIGPGRVVADVAAGTGKLTRQLLPSGARLVAVEPVAGMLWNVRDRDVEWVRGLAAITEQYAPERVRGLFDGMPEPFPVPYHTDLHWCRARS